jgi:hypothetical protein
LRNVVGARGRAIHEGSSWLNPFAWLSKSNLGAYL